MKAEFIDFTPSWSDTTEILGEPLNCTVGWEPLGYHCYKGHGYKLTETLNSENSN